MADNVIKLIDSSTNELVSYSITTTNAQGQPITDADVDGVMFGKKGEIYFKRNYTGPLNVKWWGAKGNGITDDTVAIQSALDFAGKFGTGTEVFIPSGVYLITQDLRIEKSRIRLRGQSRRNTQLSYTGTNACILLQDPTDPTTKKISDGSIDELCIRDTGGNGKYGILASITSQYIYSNIIIDTPNPGTGFSEAGLTLDGNSAQGCWTVRINNVYVYNTGGNGFYVGLQANAVFFNECHTSHVGKYSVIIGYARGISFSQCQFESAELGIEVYVYKSTNPIGNVRGLSFDNCYCEQQTQGAASRFLYVEDINAHSVRVENCYIRCMGDYAIDFNNTLSGSTTYATVSNCYMSDVGIAGILAHASTDRVADIDNIAFLQSGSQAPTSAVTSASAGITSLSFSRGIVNKSLQILENRTSAPGYTIPQGAMYYDTTNKGAKVYSEGNFQSILLRMTGTTAGRPTWVNSSTGGILYYDTTVDALIVWDGNSWVRVDPVATTTIPGLVSKSAALTTPAPVASVAAPTKAEFDAVVARLNELTAKLQAAGIQS